MPPSRRVNRKVTSDKETNREWIFETDQGWCIEGDTVRFQIVSPPNVSGKIRTSGSFPTLLGEDVTNLGAWVDSDNKWIL